jgi:hypothetical protein
MKKNEVFLMMLLVFLFTVQLGATVVYDYPSKIEVHETISISQNNTYKYNYSFTNTISDSQNDTSKTLIYSFLVFTNFHIIDAKSFDNKSWTNPYIMDEFFLEEYDYVNPSNLSDEIVNGVVSSQELTYYYWGINLGYGEKFYKDKYIEVDETVSGFSFTSLEYDASSKYYLYSTVDLGYPPETGRFSAMGTTVPEPGMFLMIAMSLIYVYRIRMSCKVLKLEC